MQAADHNTGADVIEAAGGLVWRDSPRGRELAVIFIELATMTGHSRRANFSVVSAGRRRR